MNASLRRALTGYAFIAPWLVALAVFIAYPFLAGFAFSFCDYPPMKEPLYIGLENYRELAADTEFHRSLGVTLVFAAVAIPLAVVAAVTLAMMLNARVRGQSIYRVVFYLPHLVPTVVVAILWKWIFNPEVGLFNIMLRWVLHPLNSWTGIWFDLKAAVESANFVRPQAAALVAVIVATIVLWSRMNRGPKTIAGVLAAICAVTILYATLFWLMPADMQKLQEPGWLSDAAPLPRAVPFAPSWALWALVILSMWGVGQMAIITLAKLQDVPVELYEAADVDGADWWQKTWHITLPILSPVILFNVVMAIIGTFQIFTEPYIMTQGGPEGKTRFVAMFVYENAFQYQRLGYASAVAWVLFIVIVVLTVLAFQFFRKRVYYAAR